MSEFKTQITVSLNDKFSSPAKNMVSSATEKFKSLSSSITSSATSLVGFAGGGAYLKDVVTKGMALDKTLASVKAKLGSGLDTKDWVALNGVITKLGADTEYTTQQVASAAEYLAQSGMTAQQAIGSLPGVIDLATAGSISLSQSADIATNVLSGFGLASKDAATQQKNLQRVMDVMAKTATSSNTNIVGLGYAFGEVASQAASVGVDIESVATLMAKMGDASISGTEAGNALQNMMSRLAAPTKDAQEAMAQIGLKAFDSSGKMKDLITITADLSEKTKNLSDNEKLRVLNTILGDTAMKGMLPVLQLSRDELEKYRQGLYDSNGAAKTMANTMRDTTAGAFDKMTSAIDGVGTVLYKTLSPALAVVFNGVASVAGGITDLIKGLNDLSPTATTVTASLLAVGGAVAGIYTAKKVIGGLTNRITGGATSALTGGKEPIPVFVTNMGASGIGGGMLDKLEDKVEKAVSKSRVGSFISRALPSVAGFVERRAVGAGIGALAGSIEPGAGTAIGAIAGFVAPEAMKFVYDKFFGNKQANEPQKVQVEIVDSGNNAKVNNATNGVSVKKAQYSYALTGQL